MILDISKKEHIPIINTYKKCKGITLIGKYLPDLNPINKMYIINTEEEWEIVKKEFPAQMMTVRCDCTRGIEGALPEGQTFERIRVNGYIRNVKSLVPDAVIILESMKIGTNERIRTNGGFNLDVRIGSNIYIDYVGPCFDCGILCRGKGCHESWNIPWQDIPFLKDNSVKKYSLGKINQTQYMETAKNRIKFLVEAYPDREDEIFSIMPKEYNGIKISTFRSMIENVVIPFYLKHEQLARDGLSHFGVELNVLEDDRLVPFEIAVPERFNENVIQKDR